MSEKILEAISPVVIGTIAALLALFIKEAVPALRRLVKKTPTQIDDLGLKILLAAIEKGVLIKLPDEEKPVKLSAAPKK